MLFTVKTIDQNINSIIYNIRNSKDGYLIAIINDIKLETEGVLKKYNKLFKFEKKHKLSVSREGESNLFRCQYSYYLLSKNV